jgi:F0F1-type ATP synthase delta subunit
MSDFEKIARPYSKALFELAAESKSLQAWSDSLKVAAAIVDDEAMQAMFEL